MLHLIASQKGSLVKSSAPARILFHVYQFSFFPEVLKHDCFLWGSFVLFFIPSPILDFSIWLERLLHQHTFTIQIATSKLPFSIGLEQIVVKECPLEGYLINS